MADQPQKSELWTELGAEGLSKQKRTELRKKAVRSDRLYFFLLVPAGFVLIFGGIAWMILGEFISSWGIGVICLGITAWVGAAKIAMGK